MNVKPRARGQGGKGEEGAGDRRALAPRCLEHRRCTERAGLPDPEPEGGSVCSFGSVRLMDQGSVGVVLLASWTVSCHIVVVQSELGEPGAITLCFQVRGLAMLQALYRLVMNGPVIDLYTQSEKLIAS